MNNKERIEKAYKELDRSYFLDEHRELAKLDRPLPIGHEQTISQPSLVLQMTILLDPKEDSKVLEIGTGSGYQAALLSKVSGEVWTIERIEELHETSKKKLKEGGYSNVNCKLSDGSQGWEEEAPYDRIMVTAAAKKMPEKLIEQLAPKGKMVVPVGDDFVQDLVFVEKDEYGEVTKESVEKVRFVKLIGDY